MSESIHIYASGENYEEMLGNAFVQVKNLLPETVEVLREEPMYLQHDGEAKWFLSSAMSSPSRGGTQVHGDFVFERKT